MNKFTTAFQKHPVFIAYITAGHKGLDYSLQAALALIAGGVDILEIGIPFSDPIADGPVIQNAMLQALQLNTNIFDVLQLVKNIRQYSAVPIVLFSYYNPIFQVLKTDFFAQAHACGVDGILIVDLPLEEAQLYVKKCREVEIAPIFVIAPSTNNSRFKMINKYAAGFIYYACRKGTTGAHKTLPNDYIRKIKNIKKHMQLPVVSGFGIASKSSATAASKYADGFVVGSYFVSYIEQGATPDELTKLAIAINQKTR